MLGQMPYGHHEYKMGVKAVGLHFPKVGSNRNLWLWPSVHGISPPFISGDFGQAPYSVLSRTTRILYAFSTHVPWNWRAFPHLCPEPALMQETPFSPSTDSVWASAPGDVQCYAGDRLRAGIWVGQCLKECFGSHACGLDASQGPVPGCELRQGEWPESSQCSRSWWLGTKCLGPEGGAGWCMVDVYAGTGSKQGWFRWASNVAQAQSSEEMAKDEAGASPPPPPPPKKKGKTRFRKLNFVTMAMRRHRRVLMSFVLWTHSGGIIGRGQINEKQNI